MHKLKTLSGVTNTLTAGVALYMFSLSISMQYYMQEILYIYALINIRNTHKKIKQNQKEENRKYINVCTSNHVSMRTFSYINGRDIHTICLLVTKLEEYPQKIKSWLFHYIL